MEKSIEKFPNYTINTDGVVVNKVTGHIKSIHIGKNGYKVVSLYNKGETKDCLLHRLLALAFIPNPENKPQVNHIDGVKTNNALANLEWVTQSENIQHAYDTGLMHKPVYINKTVSEAYLRRILQGCTFTSIAEKDGFAVSTVAKYVRRISKELGLEEQLDEMLRIQKLQRQLRLNDYPRKRSTLK